MVSQEIEKPLRYTEVVEYCLSSGDIGTGASVVGGERWGYCCWGEIVRWDRNYWDKS